MFKHSKLVLWIFLAFAVVTLPLACLPSSSSTDASDSAADMATGGSTST
jgi:hypothetical protein